MDTESSAPTCERREDDGFGMVEIVVALLMLGILAVALLPLLIQGLQLSADNATRATATQILHDRLEMTRTLTTKCTEITTAIEGNMIAGIEDPRGIEFQIATDVGTCPTLATAFPTTVSVTIAVRRMDDLLGDPLASATTLLYVAN